MAYDKHPPLCLTLTFLDGMVDFSSRESIRVLFKDAQAGAGTEVDPLAAINGPGVSIGSLSLPPQAVLYSGNEMAEVSVKAQFSL